MPVSNSSLKQMLHEIRRIEQSREKLTEKKIQAIYQSLMDDLDAALAKGYKRYADGDGRLYMAYLDSKRARAKFLQEIVENVESISPDLKKQMMNLVDKTYEECYKGMSETVSQAVKAGGVETVARSLSVRPETLQRAVENNISKLTLTPVMQKHRAEIIYQIQQELNLGLIAGDRYERMAKRISERVGVSMSKAMNIVRTESHRNIESGMMDCAENLSAKLDGSGLIYAATWRTMKDERVRPNVRRKTKHGWRTYRSKNGANHERMEGVTVRVGELFDLGNGVKTIAPGQSGDASNDCRCRCFLEYNLMTVEEFAEATKQTPAQVRKKYSMVSAEPVELPKSLDNFDTHQKEWVKKQFNLSEEKIKIVEEGIQSVIDNNAYSMRIHADDLQSIIEGGFKSQFETQKSSGMLSSQYRKAASRKLFGCDTSSMEPGDYEKYGYLGSKDLVADAKSSTTSQYGKTIVKFKKDNLKGRVTYTIGDSLDGAISGEMVGGKIADGCSISGVPTYDVGRVTNYFMESDLGDINNADDLAQILGGRYWELQYHGDLKIDDVESICFTGTARPKEDVIKQLREYDIKTYEITEDGDLNDL